MRGPNLHAREPVLTLYAEPSAPKASEIARILGVKADTVRAIICRARRAGDPRAARKAAGGAPSWCTIKLPSFLAVAAKRAARRDGLTPADLCLSILAASLLRAPRQGRHNPAGNQAQEHHSKPPPPLVPPPSTKEFRGVSKSLPNKEAALSGA